MVKVHFNERIETVETYDAGDYDRTSVPIAELNDAEFNEMECYRLEMKKQTIEEYQKRWKKSRNTNSSDSPVSASDSDNSSPILKSCLIRKGSNSSNKLNSSAMNAALSAAMSSSLEDDTPFFRQGQAQPNIILNTPHSSEYNSDECNELKDNVILSSSLESDIEHHIPDDHPLHLFIEPDPTEEDEIKEKTTFVEEQQPNIVVISPLSFNGTDDGPTSENDADIESEDNSFIRLFEDSFEEKHMEDEGEESDYIKDMSLTEGENSISLSHHLLSDDIPTTSFHSSTHRLFTDSIFNTSPILSKSVIETVDQKKDSSLEEEEEYKIIDDIEKEKEEVKEEVITEKEEKEIKVEEEEEKEEKEKVEVQCSCSPLMEEPEQVEGDDDEEDEDDEIIDKHSHSDTYINYGGTQHINIKPRRNNLNDDYSGISSCPFGKPISFLDDLPETFHTPLSSSLPISSSSRSTSSNFFGSPFSPPSKSPYGNNNSSSSYTNRKNRYGSSSSHSNGSGSGSNNDGSYLVSKRNYLSISGNRDSKPKSYSSSSRLSHFTTSKWEGIGSRSSKSNNNSSTSPSTTNKYYPRPATKLITTSPFSSSWIYDASF